MKMGVINYKYDDGFTNTLLPLIQAEYTSDIGGSSAWSIETGICPFGVTLDSLKISSGNKNVLFIVEYFDNRDGYLRIKYDISDVTSYATLATYEHDDSWKTIAFAANCQLNGLFSDADFEIFASDNEDTTPSGSLYLKRCGVRRNDLNVIASWQTKGVAPILQEGLDGSLTVTDSTSTVLDVNTITFDGAQIEDSGGGNVTVSGGGGAGTGYCLRGDGTGPMAIAALSDLSHTHLAGYSPLTIWMGVSPRHAMNRTESFFKIIDNRYGIELYDFGKNSSEDIYLKYSVNDTQYTYGAGQHGGMSGAYRWWSNYSTGTEYFPPPQEVGFRLHPNGLELHIMSGGSITNKITPSSTSGPQWNALPSCSLVIGDGFKGDIYYIAATSNEIINVDNSISYYRPCGRNTINSCVYTMFYDFTIGPGLDENVFEDQLSNAYYPTMSPGNLNIQSAASIVEAPYII